jgi:ribosomal-protein-alanine N-acetyltransferase
MIFETERLYVSRWKKEDLGSLYQLFNDEAIKEFILPKLTMQETMHIFKEQLKNYESDFPFGRYFIVEKLTNDCIGLFLLKTCDQTDCIEIGYSLKKERWANGFATEIVTEAVHWLSAMKKFTTVIGVTETDNTNSQNVLLKCAFVREDNFIEDNKEMSLFKLAI